MELGALPEHCGEMMRNHGKAGLARRLGCAELFSAQRRAFFKAAP